MTETTKLERVGFIGLGFIGAPMAERLVEAGFETWVYDIVPSAMQPLVDSGAKAASSIAELAQNAQIIGVCVVDDAQTEDVVTGAQGILDGARQGTVVALHGTIHPETCRRLASAAAKRDVTLVDAQMTGGPQGAATGTLRYMVGGTDDDFERVHPFLAASASEITHCGPLGSGSVTKIANNLVQYCFWQALIEAQELTRSQEVADDKLVEVLGWIMNDNARLMIAGRNALESEPTNEFLAERFGAAGKLLEKDLKLALELGSSLDLRATKLCSTSAPRIFALPTDDASTP